MTENQKLWILLHSAAFGTGLALLWKFEFQAFAIGFLAFYIAISVFILMDNSK